MSDRWNKLRDQFKTKNIDLDAEFEKFLNEVGLLCLNFKRVTFRNLFDFLKQNWMGYVFSESSIINAWRFSFLQAPCKGG